MNVTAKKIFVFFSVVLISSCQKNAGEPIVDPVYNSTKTKSPQKPVEIKIDPADHEVYNTRVLDTLPKYPGGINKLHVFLNKNYVIPEEYIQDDGPSFAVFATFIIEKDGTLSNIKILRDSGYGTGEELQRVLKLSPGWKPGFKDGKAVRCLYSLPYYFIF